MPAPHLVTVTLDHHLTLLAKLKRYFLSGGKTEVYYIQENIKFSQGLKLKVLGQRIHSSSIHY